MPKLTGKPPRQADYAFDLEPVYASMVALQAHIPKDAFTASVLGTERGGNGIFIRDSGIILTIGYLITEAETIWITDHSGNAVPGDVLGYDQESGFGLVQALGRLDAESLPIGRSAEVREGDPVVVAGFGGETGSVGAEVIAVREFAGYWEYLLEEAIFTVPMHPNWGGTALVGANGELLGVGSLFIQQGGADDVTVDGNMMVPIDLLEPIYDDMITVGRPNRASRPWMGLFGTETESRVEVAGLVQGGPADQANVRVNDIVLAVSGKPVSSLTELFREVWSLGSAGVEVPLTLGRKGAIVDTTINSVARSDMLKAPRLH